MAYKGFKAWVKVREVTDPSGEWEQRSDGVWVHKGMKKPALPTPAPVSHAQPQASAGVANAQSPGTGEDFSGPNPYYDQDTGAVLDDAKAREWERRKRAHLDSKRGEAGQEIAAKLARQERRKVLEAAEKEFGEIFDRNMETYVTQNISDPFREHTPTAKMFQVIMKKHGLTQQEIMEVFGWFKNKVNYLSTIAKNPQMKSDYLRDAQRQRDKHAGKLDWNK